MIRKTLGYVTKGKLIISIYGKTMRKPKKKTSPPGLTNVPKEGRQPRGLIARGVYDKQEPPCRGAARDRGRGQGLRNG